MKAPYVVGVVLAVIILAAGVFAPQLRSSDAKTAARAVAEATTAQHKLAQVDTTLTRLRRHLDEDRLKEGPAEVRSVAADLFKTMQDHEALLGTAIREAAAAVGIDATALGVAQVQGMAQYVQATALYTDAVAVRTQQVRAAARLLGLADDWLRARGFLDHYRGLDVAPVLARLKADVEELAALRTQAQDDLAALTARTRAAEQQLAEAERALADARAELLQVEEQGFRAGDDASFEAYRQRYLALTARLSELQQAEQELRYGGLRGATFTGDDLATAELAGGETVVGVEELQRKLATAEERARRLEGAHLSLEDRMKTVTEMGRQAQAEAERYQKRVDELAAEQKTAAEAVIALAKQAEELAGRALQSAEAAARSYRQSHTAVEAFIRAARTAKSERDPEGRNARLKAITQAPYLAQYAQSAEAAALVLAARIQAQRVDACQQIMADMRLLAEMNSAFARAFDPAPLMTIVETARPAGLDALEKARGIYEKLSTDPAATAWVSQAALAAAYHLTARLDPANASTHLSKTAELIQKAVDKRELSPYVQPLVPFRDHIGLTATPAKPAGDGTGAGFFGDEK